MKDITNECSKGEDNFCEEFENILKLQDEDFNIANEEGNLESEYWKLCKSLKNDIEELKTTLSNLKTGLAKLHICKNKLEETTKLKNDAKAKEEDELKKEIQTMQSICKKTKKEIELLKEESKPHENDIAIIDKNRKCIKLLKDFTGIKWDYTASNHSECAGVVFNPTKHYIKRFSYSTKEKDNLWDEIETSALLETSSQTDTDEDKKARQLVQD